MRSDSQPHRPEFPGARTDFRCLFPAPVFSVLVCPLVQQAPCVALHLHQQQRAEPPPKLIKQGEDDIEVYNVCRLRMEARLSPSLQDDKQHKTVYEHEQGSRRSATEV